VAPRPRLVARAAWVLSQRSGAFALGPRIRALRWSFASPRRLAGRGVSGHELGGLGGESSRGCWGLGLTAPVGVVLSEASFDGLPCFGDLPALDGARVVGRRF
jgi:hypothetical protein